MATYAIAKSERCQVTMTFSCESVGAREGAAGTRLFGSLAALSGLGNTSGYGFLHACEQNAIAPHAITSVTVAR